MTSTRQLLIAMFLAFGAASADDPKAKQANPPKPAELSNRPVAPTPKDLPAGTPFELRNLSETKKKYGEVAEQYKLTVLKMYQDAIDRVVTAGKKDLEKRLTDDRDRFLYEGTESVMFESRLVDVMPLKGKLKAAQAALVEAYQKAHGYYARKGLLAEKAVLQEELNEFEIIASGRPRRFHSAEKSLRAKEYSLPGGNGPKVDLLTLLGAVGNHPSLKLLNKPPRDRANNAKRAVGELIALLGRKNSRVELLDKALADARQAVNHASGVGNGNVRQIMQNLRKALAEPPAPATQQK